MTYLTKIRYTTNDIVNKLFSAIEQNFSHFDEWIFETNEFEEMFRSSFYDFFCEFMDELIEEQIKTLGTNTQFLIIAYIGTHNNITLVQMKKFVKLYIELILQKDSSWAQALKYNMEDDYISSSD